MKRKHIYGIVLCFISVIGFSLISSGQRCDKKDLCNDEDYGDFDFRSQTHFAKLSPGDTATINIVAYSGNDLRILVCGDPDLGDITYQVIESKRDPVREVKHFIRVDKNPVYEPNNGDDMDQRVKMDSNGDTVFTIEKVPDSTVTSRFNVYDKVLFDNKKQTKDKPYYEEKNIQKTKRLKVKVQVPKGEEDDYIGCVNVLVGRKAAKTNKFYRGKD